jgi:putative transposase
MLPSCDGPSVFLLQKQGQFPAKSEPERRGFAVKKRRFSVEQIVAILKQAELGIPVAELIPQVAVSEQTFYRWKKRKYTGLEIDQIRQLKEMAEEKTFASVYSSRELQD